MSDADLPTTDHPVPAPAQVAAAVPGSAGGHGSGDEAFGAGAPDEPTHAGPTTADATASTSGPAAGPAARAAAAAENAAADVVTGAAEGVTTTCSGCGEPLVGTAKFCEACGAPTAAVDIATSPGAAGERDALACVKCGAAVGDDRYCTMCGHRALEPVTLDDRGAAAYATHRGRRHDRNEDAAALAATAEGFPVLVVSDGVSVSPNPHLASAAAVAAAATRLAGRPFAGNNDLVDAVGLAHRAACEVPASGDPHWVEDGTHPACTIVVAVVSPTGVHMANVGDARGYLLTATTAAEAESAAGTEPAPVWTAVQLTSDDSVAAEAVEMGVDPDLALGLEGGHAITAWLGADAPEVEANLATRGLSADDLVLVCSDGLWNYATTDAALGGLVSAHLPPPGAAPGALGPPCEALVGWANGRGGLDNITVTIARVPGEDRADSQREAPQ